MSLPPSYIDSIAPKTIDTMPVQTFDSAPIAPVMSKYDTYAKRKELNLMTKTKIFDVVSDIEIIFLIDDSDSMNNSIAEEGIDPFIPKLSSRWIESKKLVAQVIDLVTCIKLDNGIDIHFLNRESVYNVKSLGTLQSTFSTIPNGKTPLIGSLRRVYGEKRSTLPPTKKLLIIVVSDGEQSDGSREDLRRAIIDITADNYTYLECVECTDQADDMEFLDAWKGTINHFDNTDDYREELNRVRNIQGGNFKFDFTDYVIKIIMAPFDKWFRTIDQSKVQDYRNTDSSGYSYPVTNVQSSQPYYGASSSYTQPMNSYVAPTTNYTMPTLQNSYPQSGSYGNQAMSAKTGGCCVIL